MSEHAAQRLSVLDGLRGWAAVSVVVFHLTWECFGGLYPQIRSLPLALVANGNMAVGLFLMVSGYVLTIRGWRSADKSGVRHSMLKRYFRLTIPIFGSVPLYWAVLAAGLSAAPAAATIVDSPDWLGQFGLIQPDFLAAIAYGLIGVYLRSTAYEYGPFLWTMVIELWGSFFVLGLCLFELRRAWAYVPVLALTVAALSVTRDPYLPIAACYVCGTLVALITKDGLIRTGTPTRRESVVASVLLIVSLGVAALAQAYDLPRAAIVPFAMIGFVAALRSGPVSRFLALPVSQWLGRISFPLYLLQILVIVTVTSWLVVWANAAAALSIWTAVGIALASIAACLALAWLYLPVERLALRMAALAISPLVPKA